MLEEVAKQARLVDRLYALTAAKKIAWSGDSLYGPVEARIGEVSVTLCETNFDGNPYELITISNPYGGELQKFTDGTLSDVPKPDDFETYWKKMTALRELAARQALRIEETLDRVLAALDEIESPKPRTSPFESDLDDDVPF
jgi:hypothetical protein